MQNKRALEKAPPTALLIVHEEGESAERLDAMIKSLREFIGAACKYVTGTEASPKEMYSFLREFFVKSEAHSDLSDEERRTIEAIRTEVDSFHYKAAKAMTVLTKLELKKESLYGKVLSDHSRLNRANPFDKMPNRHGHHKTEEDVLYYHLPLFMRAFMDRAIKAMEAFLKNPGWETYVEIEKAVDDIFPLIPDDFVDNEIEQIGRVCEEFRSEIPSYSVMVISNDFGIVHDFVETRLRTLRVVSKRVKRGRHMEKDVN